VTFQPEFLLFVKRVSRISWAAFKDYIPIMPPLNHSYNPNVIKALILLYQKNCGIRGEVNLKLEVY
jgi:hypothetical protein